MQGSPTTRSISSRLGDVVKRTLRLLLLFVCLFVVFSTAKTNCRNLHTFLAVLEVSEMILIISKLTRYKYLSISS